MAEVFSRKMKNLHTLVALCFASSFAACSSDTNPDTPDTSTTTDSSVSDAETSPPGDVADAETDGTPPVVCPDPTTDLVAKFDLPATGAPAVLDVPWPSDVYRDDAGKLPSTFAGLAKIIPKQSELIAPQFALAGAFGTYGGSSFAIVDDKPIDPKSLPDETTCGKPGSSAFIVDLDAADKSSAFLPCTAGYYNETPKVPTAPAITVRPAVGSPMPSNHRIAVILTTGVKGVDGKALQPSATLASIRQPAPGAGKATKAAQFYKDAIDKAASLGVDKCSIASITSYKTFDVDGDIANAHQALAATTAPKLSWKASDVAPMGTGLFSVKGTEAGFAASLDAMWGVPTKAPTTFYDPPIDEPGLDLAAIAHDSIGAMGTAIFQAPNFMVADPAGRTSPKHNNWFRSADGKPAINPAQPTNKIWVTIVLPKTPPPASGYPVVIWQHGFGGDRIDMMAAANVWAREGFATVAINLATHGPRADATDTDLLKDVSSRVTPWYPAAGTGKTHYGSYDGPDGFSDTEGGAGNLVGAYVNFVTLRDQLRQSALDLSSLVRMIKSSPDLGPLSLAVPGAKLDGSKIAFYGVSFGAIIGTIFVGQEPDVQHVILNVGGGGLAIELTPNSPSLMSGGNVAVLFGLQYGLTFDTKLPPETPMLHALQHLIDGADPISFAAHVQKSPLTIGGTKNAPKNLLDLFARHDDYVVNEANEALVRALGIPIAKPHLPLIFSLPETDAPSGAFTAAAGSKLGLSVMESPAHHAGNVAEKRSFNNYKIPLRRLDSVDLLSQITPLDDAKKYTVAQPTYASHKMMASFLRSGFAGGAVKVTDIPTPVDDFDGDGFTDDVDKDPNDPTVH